MLFLILDKPCIDPYLQLNEIINNAEVFEYYGPAENEYDFYSEIYTEMAKDSENPVFYIIGSILSFAGIIYFIKGIANSLY